MRKATHDDAELLLRLYEVRREPELRAARRWFLTEFQEADWATIKQRYLSHSDEDRWFRMTVSYWEMVATIVNMGVLHAELFFDHTGEDLVTWERCRPWIEGARRDVRPTYLYQFERMARAHQAHREKTIAAHTKASSAPARSTAARRTRRAR